MMCKNGKVFFLCGPHCSGKTSILEKLHDEGIIEYRATEIGKDLYYQRKLVTSAQDEEFEFEVTRLELDRDKDIYLSDKHVGIETWHPGNMAYAMIRNPDCVSALKKVMLQTPLLNEIIPIRISVSKVNIYNRTKTFSDDRQWASEFYSKIDNKLDSCLNELGLLDITMRVDGNKPFKEVYEEVKRHVMMVY